ncbi:type II toxin-antitoxin system RelE/ParE family toxin [Sphingomonas sp. VNH70]|uniref:type II toxin-antitoxin system RelE/ParE family toxin n=1 Tax=Sphingomonas silueang TaxID=3156617 RepID=UPI0032B5FD36
MKRLLLTPAARDDLAAIWNYSESRWDADQPDRYVETIVHSCDRLVQGRLPGCAVDVRPGYRKQRAGSHMIHYRDEADRIEVIRILHMRQDVSLHL